MNTSDRGHADVLIIGAGPSGGVAALRLAKAGLSVVCLEQGEWMDPTEYRGGERDWELTSLKQWHWDPNVRQLPMDYKLDVADCEEEVVNFNAVGGGTVLYNAVWTRMTPRNFRSASAAGYGADWPFDYEELRRHYEQTDREVGASGLGGNPLYPDGAEPPLPPLPIREAGMTVARAHARLGWHWWPETNAILSVPYDGRHQCAQRGTCVTGCGEGAKGSADVVYWRHVKALGGDLVTGARVTRIVTDGQGRAAGAEWYDREGNGHLQTADVVLCAANGIGTTRLLLNSATPEFPDGLANSSGLVGRGLMLHHHAYAFGIFEELFDTWGGQKGGLISSSQFYESDDSHGAPGTCKWILSGTNGPLTSVLSMGPDAWGPAHHQVLAAGFGHTLLWYLAIEDLALDDNRVELSATETDSAGLPIPVIHYHIPEQAKTLGRFHQARAAESLQEAGAQMTLTPDVTPTSGHLMGTARMGNDRGRSVVDRYAMSHDIPNLGILDGSVFVTSGGVNPTSTITSVASRTATKLIERRAVIPRPDLPRSFAISRPQVPAAPTPTSYEPVLLTARDKARLAEFALALIPPDDSHPSPSDVGVSEHLVGDVLKARPDLGAALRRGLATEGDPMEALDALGASDPEARSAVEVTVAGAYYMSPEVWEAIGYPGQPAQPVPPDTFPVYIEENLLDHLLVADESAAQ